ncbi:MAG: BCCT family transporter [Desulfobacter sp.]
METDATLSHTAPGRPEKKSLVSIINKRVFVPPALVLVLAVAIGVASPEAFGKGASAALSFTLEYFGWFYTLGASFLFVFCLWAGFGKYGNIRLGGPDAKPELSMFNWWAISICAGIAIGIVFFGVAEPISHYTSPPPFLGYEPASLAAGEHAMRYAFFHWTFHTYGIYVSAALCIAFAFYNTKKPFRVSSSLFPVIGDRINGNWGYFVDGLSIFAIVGGVGTSLGFGTMQIGGGLKFLWGIEPNQIVWLAIIACLTLCYTVSSYTGLQKGIRILSENNIRLYFVLMAFVLFCGPTIHTLESTVTAVGDYLGNLVSMSLFLDPMEKSGWPGAWSNFYWAWWLAFAPIVGLFLVRLGHGRTVRQFVLVNMVGPAVFGMVWFGIFGSTAIYLDHFKGAGIAATIAEHGNEVSLFALFQQFPLSGLTMVLGMLAVAISFITLADSMTSTIASMTTKGFGTSAQDKEAPAGMKIFWGVVMGLFSWVLLVSGGASALQTSVIVCGLPILVLQIVMAAGYIKAMGNPEKYDRVNH